MTVGLPQVTNNGAYLVPVVWNKRLILFFPQFTKKTEAIKSPPIHTQKDVVGGKETGNTTTNMKTEPAPERWGIKMAWSEHRNGKWMQKQVSVEAIYCICQGFI